MTGCKVLTWGEAERKFDPDGTRKRTPRKQHDYVVDDMIEGSDFGGKLNKVGWKIRSRWWRNEQTWYNVLLVQEKEQEAP